MAFVPGSAYALKVEIQIGKQVHRYRLAGITSSLYWFVTSLEKARLKYGSLVPGRSQQVPILCSHNDLPDLCRSFASLQVDCVLDSIYSYGFLAYFEDLVNYAMNMVKDERLHLAGVGMSELVIDYEMSVTLSRLYQLPVWHIRHMRDLLGGTESDWCLTGCLSIAGRFLQVDFLW
jgi:hypothetical protein